MAASACWAVSPIPATASSDRKALDPWTVLPCNGFIELGDIKFHCWLKGGHGGLSVLGGLSNSCDCFFRSEGARSVDRAAVQWLHRAGRHQVPLLAEGRPWRPQRAGRSLQFLRLLLPIGRRSIRGPCCRAMASSSWATSSSIAG